ncbi:MAG: PIN domain-containing protein [Actinomycetota bacterium]
MALILDTGVVYAALDRDDRDHVRCRTLIEAADELRVLPAPILPEVDYWVTQHLGVGVMVSFLRDIVEGSFMVEHLEAEDYPRIVSVIDDYADAEVGFVDAAVLAVAERMQETKIATLDRRHFSLLRPAHASSLDLLPE